MFAFSDYIAQRPRLNVDLFFAFFMITRNVIFATINKIINTDQVSHKIHFGTFPITLVIINRKFIDVLVVHSRKLEEIYLIYIITNFIHKSSFFILTFILTTQVAKQQSIIS